MSPPPRPVTLMFEDTSFDKMRQARHQDRTRWCRVLSFWLWRWVCFDGDGVGGKRGGGIVRQVFREVGRRQVLDTRWPTIRDGRAAGNSRLNHHLPRLSISLSLSPWCNTLLQHRGYKRSQHCWWAAVVLYPPRVGRVNQPQNLPCTRPCFLVTPAPSRGREEADRCARLSAGGLAFLRRRPACA